MCSRLIVFVETNRFNRHEDFYSNSVQMKLSFPTSSSLEIVEFAVKGLKHIFREGLHYKRAGVILIDFVDDNAYQPSLFFNSNPKHKQLMAQIDAVNDKYRKQIIRLAAQDNDPLRKKQQHLTKEYTTDIHDILQIDVT
jgi:DNA polymerase V